MGLLDDYLNESDTKQPAKPVTKTGSGIVDMYLSSPDSETAAQTPDDSRPRPFTAEESAAAKARPAANPRDSQLWEGIKNTPSRFYSDLSENVTGAANLLGSGLSNVVGKDKSALERTKGIGQTGLGLLAGLTAIPGAVIQQGETAINSAIGKPEKFKQLNVFGNPVTGQDIEIAGPGERTGFTVASGLPLVKGSAAIVGLPTESIVGAINSRRPTNVAMRELVD